MKTKHILFLCRQDEREDYDTAGSMAQAMQAAPSGMAYAAADLEDLVFAYDGAELSVTDAAGGRDLKEYDGIFLLGWFKTKMLEDAALAVACYAEAHGVPVLNSEARYTRSRTKLSQSVLAALHGCSLTPFVFAINSQHAQPAGMAFPLIVKSVQGSRGRDNFLVHNQTELGQVLADHPETPFILQTFVPNDGDYRLLVMGDRVELALYRQATAGSHLNNTSQGGSAAVVDVATLDQAMLAEAVKIAQLVRREVTGVDMIVHNQTGRYYFLEVNNMPQLSTGKFVPEKMRALDEYFTRWLTP